MSKPDENENGRPRLGEVFTKEARRELVTKAVLESRSRRKALPFWKRFVENGWDLYDDLAGTFKTKKPRYAFRLAGALATVCVLFISISLFRPRTETWSDWKAVGGIKGSETNSAVASLIESSPVNLKPDFKEENVLLQFEGLNSLFGGLTNAPNLNTFSDPTVRYFRLFNLKNNGNGAIGSAEGVLELHSPMFTNLNTAPKLKNINEAILTLRLTLTNGAEFQVTRSIKK